MNHLSSNIKLLRTQRKLTHTLLAKLSGVKEKHIKQAEKSGDIVLADLLLLAEALKLSIDTLVRVDLAKKYTKAKNIKLLITPEPARSELPMITNSASSNSSMNQTSAIWKILRMMTVMITIVNIGFDRSGKIESATTTINEKRTCKAVCHARGTSHLVHTPAADEK